jgi:hypothetical protein
MPVDTGALSVNPSVVPPVMRDANGNYSPTGFDFGITHVLPTIGADGPVGWTVTADQPYVTFSDQQTSGTLSLGGTLQNLDDATTVSATLSPWASLLPNETRHVTLTFTNVLAPEDFTTRTLTLTGYTGNVAAWRNYR